MTLDSLPATGTDRAAEICTLNDPLDALAKQEPRRAKVIELWDGIRNYLITAAWTSLPATHSRSFAFEAFGAML